MPYKPLHRTAYIFLSSMMCFCAALFGVDHLGSTQLCILGTGWYYAAGL